MAHVICNGIRYYFKRRLGALLQSQDLDLDKQMAQASSITACPVHESCHEQKLREHPG